ncbi:SDR family NAD(P)-dependent oxidoreductase [Streptomyces klenkii]|uniref:SDR family NAD(P)-dependent oxidoreductase n=1 Tax=Streptomyces klenkii TaxID=1420899 RepID=UPI0033BAEC70
MNTDTGTDADPGNPERPQNDPQNGSGNDGDIAIIGLALRLPGADTLEELWRHLDAGRSLISEVPAERWSKERYFGDPRRGAEKTSSIWGGFIEDADRFDASFFQISPREAETMDPQQRFALELAWRAIEDAGYRASAFAGTRTGVFMGVCHADYAELMEREKARTDAYFPTGTAYSIISNRVSYFLDLQGPSITNDTACSSSLVSVYEAVTALRNGDCTTALAGGVNLCWSPKHFVAFSQASMLSRTGECRAFDQGADGYVRGEGGAVLLLKPLARALADGDPVHAVIKGVATNHGGRTSSLTVTNPAAQANLIEGLYTRAGIRPETVTYIEAHGPGTPVGDPIEVIALKRAFHALHEAQGTRPEPESCGIGSVKTNIGHLEGAAGVAGMAKVIGALAGRRLPATVNFEVRNKLIKLDGSPFRIVRDTEPWAEPPTGSDGRPAPRRAGVSSFGFGGTNAHVVLEEHAADHLERQPGVHTGPHLVPLSAKTPDRLRAVAEGLLAHLRPPEPGDAAVALRQPQDLADIAYTLRTGREPMPTRVAFVVASAPELTQALEAFLAGTLAGAEAHPGATVRAAYTPAEDGLVEAAGRWARGETEDLPEPQTADGAAKPRRVRLPAYPFARERHWFKTPDAEPAQGPAALHPLLHRNTSGLAGQRYTSTFTGDEPFLAAHRVGGARVLPAVAYLEMARAAVADATGHAPGHPAVRLRDVVWTRPLIAGDAPVDVHVHLAPRTGAEGAGGELAFEVTVTPGDATTAVVHGRGTAELLPSEEPEEPETLDLGALRTACRTPHAPEDAYAAFRAQGLDYGPAMRGLDEILLGEGQLLARIQAPAPENSPGEGLVLPPSVLDAAFQSSLVLMAQSSGTAGPTMPFALERIDIHRPCAAVAWAWVRRRPGGGAAAAFDIDLCDAEGVVGVRLRGLVQRTDASKTAPAGPRVVTATCRWTDAPAAPSAAETGPETVHAFLTGKAAARTTPGLAGTPGLTLTHLPDITPGRLAEGIDAALGLVLAHVQQVLAARPRTPHRFVVLVDDRVPRHFHAPLTGLLATVALENPLVSGRVVRVAGLDTTPPERITQILRTEAADPEPFTEIRRAADGTRRAWRPADVALGTGPEVPPLKEGGVYWVTGGLGGLGRHVARYFARRPGVTVVLSGRSAAGPASEEALAALRAAGVDAHYLPADTGSADDVARAVREITRAHGSLDGIVHAAGVLRDAYVLRKEPADLPAVLEPKVRGVLSLDAATRALALDFFVVFSSVAGVYGNPGQADYAAANAFLDAFAHHRQALVAAGERTGRTAAVSWPLWADGGMTVDDVTRESMRRQRGWEPLPTEEGLRVLGRVLDDAPAHVVVAYGADPTLAHLPAGPPPAPVDAAAAAAAPDGGALRERAEGLLKELLGEVIHRDPATMEATVNLIEYGIDSLSILEMTARLEERFGPLSKTLFFEYLNIEGVAGYFVEAHRERLEAVLGAGPAAAEETPPVLPEAPAPAPVPALPGARDDRHDIAIIGISGRYPGAGTLDELWTLLEEGRHTFEEVPRDRWDHDAVYSPDRDVPGKSAIRTGTFLRDIDKFDPRYFRVSKREAERMSPEVRLFLQAGVEALEDAGYSRETIQRQYQGDVAVLAGTMSNHYNLYGFQNSLTRGAPATGSYTGTLPNMLSYFYGLTGPSIFLDTMCSASSTCVHQAVQMLRAGECRMAVAGGVNLLLHPYNLITSSQEHFTTATSDVIRSFGLGADGTILGEGVGAVVLKPLADAERDGDRIHAVIKGTALSNAGVRNGFTVPNPHMQARAVEKALDDAGVDARTISYVEGHGSGTSLGDPIEVKALTTAFGKHTGDTGFCALGSVKSNTGHLLAAAGMAGLAKVVLQLREGKLAPSLHSAELNPDIAFADTPFRVQRELADWKPAVTTDGGRETVHPRRAGLTSIGAGGMNSHIILEEYRAATEEPYAHDGREELFVFSAMTDAALAEVLTRFRAHLAGAAEDGLPSIAHTLRVGKNELPRRWAFLAGNRHAALAAVDRYLAGDRDTGTALASHDPRAATARTLATAWLGGKSVDWSELTGSRPPRRVSLPAYPFEQVRCWAEEEPGAPSVTAPLALRERLHPFLGRNASDVEGLRYVLDVRLDDLLDYGHRHDKERAVAPTFAADLALAAAKASGFAAAPVVRGLRLPGEVPWASTTRLITSLTVTGAGAASGVVSAEDITGECVTVAEFGVHPGGAPADHRPGLPVDALERDAVRALTRDEFLAELAEGGLEHDPLYCGVQGAYWLPDGRLLLALIAPRLRQDHGARHVTLAPHVLTAAAQGLRLVAKRAHAPRWARTTPYGIEEIRVSGDPADVAYVLFEPFESRPGAGSLSGHVRLLDRDGRAVGELTGVRCGDDASPRDASLRDAASRDASPRKEEGMTRPEPPGAPRPATEPPRAGGADPGTGIVPFAVAELRDIASGILKFAPDELDGHTTFDAFGFDSISLVTFSGRVRERFGVSLSPAVFFDLRTLDALGRHLAEEFEGPVREAYARSLPAADTPRAGATRTRPAPAAPAAGTPMPIAVVGAAGRFPGAPDLDTYWANLAEGRDSVTDFPVHRYGAAYARVVENADFPKRAGVLDGADGFDAGFFRVYPREAELMDPQHRLALETVWNAVEHSAYTPAALPKNTGVFLGVSGNDYATLLTTHGVEPDAFTSTGNAHSMLANRISYVLDVRGPSEPVDTACSSSLIAVHRAMEAIRSGACDAAIAGGVNLLLSVDTFVSAHRAGMLSPDGRCKTFASDADGYVRGEGVGAVVLKPLAAAERDGDAILGVLVGSAENHGGRANSLTAPSADAQAELVAAAMGAVDPDTVGYVEAHGTGTALGDPVEVRALTTAFRRLGARGRGTCGLGSVKTNIGHLEAAAGIAGLLKVLLAMRHRVLPATLNCREINPYVELDGGPFRIVREREPWRRPRDRDGAPAPRRAGVSSFGFGGANCHVVVEEYEDHSGDDRHEEYEAVDATDATHDTARGGEYPDGAQVLIPLSARTGEQLHQRARDLLAYLEKTDAPAGLHSIAWTLQTGRVAMAERVGWVVTSRGELAARLREFLAGGGSAAGGARGRVAHDGGPTAQTPARPAATAGGGLGELLARWTEGADVDWRALHGARPPKRAHLPVYPFAYERHWIPEGTGAQGALTTREASGTPAAATGDGTAHAPVALGIVPVEAVSAGPEPAGTGALPVHVRTGARPDHGRDGAPARPLAPRNAGPAATDGAENTAPTGTVLLVPSWVPKPAAPGGAGGHSYDRRVVILCGALAQARADVERSVPGARCLTVTTTTRRADSRFTDLSRQVFEAVRELAAEERDGTTLVQVVTPSGGDEDTAGTALAGLLHTLTLEHPRITGQLLGLDGTPTGGTVAALVVEDARSAHEDVVVRHRDGERAVREWTPAAPGAGAADTPWRAGGVYLITGGAGGIGAVVARRIARDAARPVLVLAGRRPRDGRVDALLGELRAAGAEARYERADVSRWEEVRHLVARIREESGGIHGVVHSAGVLHDAALTRQTPEEWAEVLAPKVAGTVHLDRATAAAPLEFFLTFSSGAAVTGNRGQGAYATANAFLDEFAALRTARVAAGERSGRTLSLAWPLWKDGGMAVDDAARAALRRDRGLVPMESADGVAALLDAWRLGADRVWVHHGDTARVPGRQPAAGARTAVDRPRTTEERTAPAATARDTLRLLVDLFARVTKSAPGTVDPDEPLGALGLDSIMVVQLNKELSAVYGDDVPKTLFYERPTLRAVAGHLAAEHAPRSPRTDGGTVPSTRPAEPVDERPRAAARPAAVPAPAAPREPIAVIGMSGRYPGAGNIAEFWENLKAGRDCVREIPADRWPLEGFFEPDREKAVATGRSYSKWGGFVDDFAGFDPLFFKIAPRDAYAMDPQERLFLQASWEVLEDAGYTREELARRHGRRVGVFAGVTKSGHARHGAGRLPSGETVVPGLSFASVSARTSYVLDLRGPSLTVDTMCSASLTAIHEACENLHRGSCEVALAGGVNLYTHPLDYTELCRSTMLSSDARCRSFGAGGDGFVPGEGVGCVLLKPLSRALADGDRVLAVIRGTSVNHGGRTHGYTVPNPGAQAELVRDALDRAGVSARDVSYVEAHGTGTELGDPIEVKGLTTAFEQDTDDRGFCAIGSVKSSIGHLEAAAGVAGLTKAVLQLRHGQLVPSLHAEEPNPNADLGRTPFFVQRELAPWRPERGPRIAAVSSFGAGGSNAHVILEEYGDTSGASGTGDAPDATEHVVVLSARTPERLRAAAARLADFLDHEEKQHRTVRPADLAHTLRTGREAMKERLAVVVASTSELRRVLRAYLDAGEPVPGLHLGTAGGAQGAVAEIAADADLRELLVARWAAAGKLDKLAALWAGGVDLDWRALHDPAARRISLPAYPFARDRFWIGDLEPVGGNHPQRTAGTDRTTMATEPMRPPEPHPRPGTPATPGDRAPLASHVSQVVREKIAAALAMDEDALDGKLAFADYGVDSILAVRVVHELNEALSLTLPTSVLFDHSSADRLTAHLLADHGDSIAPPAATALATTVPAEERPRDVPRPPAGAREPIAVVGMSGRFAGADSLDELWQHLADGDELVTEATRWDLTGTGDDAPDRCTRGGFLDRIDTFDPMFFNISGVEAAVMDPQQRLLLEESWKALEDAGHAGRTADRRVGVYVGCWDGDYQEVVGEDAPAQAFWGNTASFVPGRVAYFLDLKGPAIAVDTSCSSSLVAIDLACKDLWSGETEMALAGGVFVQATPRLYELAGRAGMLSPTGRCHTFDHRADGFVPGEGAGVLVLKRLSDAIADGDHVHGVIRGSGVNHDGATNGITAPSSVSQERLLRDVYETFDVDVERIGLVEAHGTGTKLGDPIEFRALTRAFRADTDKSGYCAVGSVKTNLGHTQFAAGVAGVLKVLLAMRHGRIPASLHFETANEAVPLAGSPFYPSTSTHAWETPGGAPRLGVVSSFGASGTNAHLVLEEAPAARRTTAAAPRPAHLVVLSARSREQLARQVAGMAEHCRRETTLDTGDAAWTLVVGREHFAHRFACVVRDRAELLSVLDEGLDGPRAFTGEAAASRKKHTGAGDGRDRGEECLRRCASPNATDHTYRTDLGTLAELYVRGTALEYDRLFPAGAHLRVPLPTYPFARESHWAAPTPPAVARTTVPAAAPAPSHPLVHAASSVSGEPGALTATTTLTGDETLLRDHTVHGQRILPGVAHLEMARETAARALGADATTPLRMRNVTWVRPLAVEDGPQDVDVLVRPAHDGALTFKVASRAAEPVVFSEGTVALSDAPRPEPVDLAALRAECPAEVPAARVAEALRAMGIHHGDTLRAIDEAYAGRGVVLARLALPATAEPAGAPYVLHPSLMDSAVQASIALHLTGDGSPGDTAVPFALGQLELFAPCTASMWAVVRLADSSAEVSPLSRLDIDLVGPGGEVHVRMTGYASRRVAEPVPALHAPVWDAVPAGTFEAAVPSRNQRVLVVGGTPGQRAALTAAHPHAEHWSLAPGAPADEVTRAVEAAGPVDHLLWLAPGTELAPSDAAGFVAAQEDGVIAAFRMIKALVRTGHDARPLGITLVTHRALATHAHEDIRPAHAGLHGLFGSLGREYTNWTVRRTDLDGTDWPTDLTALPAHSGGDTWVRRTGQWLARRLAPCEAGPRPAAPYREGGVYVVIGGAGGLGTAWTRHVVEEYGAKVVWLGRRAHDASIDAKLRDIRGRGPGEVSYLSADATDPAALRRAHAEITARHGRIHGVVQAALVRMDAELLAGMDEAALRASLAAKTDATVAMARVFADEELDFALFFSSIQSFAPVAGQGNYAAGCTFGDSYAHFLSRRMPFPAKVMNWGWWGSVGTAASDFHRERMTRSGLLSIEPPEAMAALDTLLGGPQDQLTFVKTARPGVLEAVDPATRTTVYPRATSPVEPGAVTARPLDPAERKALSAVAAWRAEEWDPLLARTLRAHLDALGAAPRPGDAHTDVTALRERAGIHERYTSWLEHSLRAVPASAPSLDEIAREWDAHRTARPAGPEGKARPELADTMLRALPGILTGTVRPTDVMFPRGSAGLVEGCYRNNRVADAYNRALCDAAVAIVTEKLRKDPGARLRILEIGAGTGGTSAGMFAALRPYGEHIDTYTYTDLSQAFLNDARTAYGPDVPYLACARLDAEQPLHSQRIDPGSYDLVVAANVLHATRDIRNTLRNAKAALRDGGWLLLNELSGFDLFAHLTFGLLEGWWLSEDTSLRVPGSPALSPESWREVLEGEGFPSVVMVLPQARELGQQIIAARSDGIARQRVARRTSGTAGEPRRGATPRRTPAGTVTPKPSSPEAVTPKSSPVREAAPKPSSAAAVAAKPSLAEAVTPKPFPTEAVTPRPSPVEAAAAAPAAARGPELEAVSVPEPTRAPQAVPAQETRADSATAHGTEGRRDGATSAVVPDPRALAGLRTEAMAGYLRDKAAATLRIPAEKIDPSVPLADYGMDSILVLQLTNALREDLGDVPTTLLFDVESIEELAEHFLGTGTDRVDALVTSLLPAPAEVPAPGPDEEPAPAPAPERSGLSQAQLGLWLTQRISPDTTVYHVPLVFEVRGELDEAALEAAVGSLTGRHPVLGAVFREDDGVPYMETGGARRIPFERAELVAESHAERAAQVRARVAAPFDLADGPLVRTHLLTFVTPDRTEEARRVLLMTAHHIVADGVSAGLIVRTLTDAYRAAVRGESPEGGAESTRYAEFTAWEAALLDSPEGEAHLAYWARELRAPRRALDLPGDRPLDPAATPRGEEVTVKLGPGLSAALTSRARERRAGLAVVFLASYMAFLHRMTGESDLVVGLPSVGRPEARFRDVVGHFVNLLPIRCAVDGDDTYGDLLTSVRRAVLGGLEHAAYPFPAIVRALGARREGTRAPLVRTSLSYQNFEEAALFTDAREAAPGELGLRVFEGVRQESEFELEAEILQESDGFRLYLKYDANRFDAATARGLLDAWRALLERVAHEPDGRVGDPAPSAGETDAAATLCGLFAETLGLGHVSPGDDFFTLGGDSLQATRLAARAGRALGVRLSTQEVFEAPTPAALAALAARPAREEAPARPVLRRMFREGDAS